MTKSYYAILGITSDASNSEIRSAYRRLAKEFHPDHYAGNAKTFRDIQEAYKVLGDRRRRARYENKRRHAAPSLNARRQPSVQPEPLIPQQKPEPVAMGEISPIRSFRTFTPSQDEILDWLWRNFNSLDRPKSGRMEQLTLEIPLTPQQIEHGGNARIMVPARVLCRICHGMGAIDLYACHRCAGQGAITGEVPIAVGFPPGLNKDYAVVIPLDRFGIQNIRLTVVFHPSCQG